MTLLHDSDILWKRKELNSLSVIQKPEITCYIVCYKSNLAKQKQNMGTLSARMILMLVYTPWSSHAGFYSLFIRKYRNKN